MASVVRFDKWEDSEGNPVLDGTGLSIPSSALPAGSILQLVEATDTTTRTTTSSTFTDASISVSITPVSASSTLMVFWAGRFFTGQGSGSNAGNLQIADSSNVGLSGAENVRFQNVSNASNNVQMTVGFHLCAFVSAGSTATRTYKGRFSREQGTASLNDSNTGRMWILEVAA
jgi:hypothetical protein